MKLAARRICSAAALAAAFDEAFAGGREEFKAGEALGTFRFTAQRRL